MESEAAIQHELARFTGVAELVVPTDPSPGAQRQSRHAAPPVGTPTVRDIDSAPVDSQTTEESHYYAPQINPSSKTVND